MTRLLFLTKEIELLDFPTARSCCCANLSIGKDDERREIIFTSKFNEIEIIINGLRGRGNTSRNGWYLLSNLQAVGWNDKMVQINYWKAEQLDKEVVRDYLTDIILF